MGKKIFVSYKYTDDNVENISSSSVNSTVRDYVTEFEKLLDCTDHIYKGESDDKDLSSLSDDTIWNKLRDKIYDSTLTVIFISPNMKENNKNERNQWIPWEISYSLKETSRKDSNNNSITSKTNAMLAVVLPDKNGSYSYYLEARNCCEDTCIMHYTNKLFHIISNNKFNYKNGNVRICNNSFKIWQDSYCSYIKAVKWNDFKKDVQKYINKSYERQENVDDYDIVKTI